MRGPPCMREHALPPLSGCLGNHVKECWGTLMRPLPTNIVEKSSLNVSAKVAFLHAYAGTSGRMQEREEQKQG